MNQTPSTSADDARQDWWDRLSMAKQGALMEEWNRAHPPRPGEDLRSRVRVRLAWCLGAVGRPKGDGP